MDKSKPIGLYLYKTSLAWYKESMHTLQTGIDYPGVSIVFFCHDGKGNFVMAQRSPHARDEHNKWDIGAGKLDAHLSVEETLKKEISEEYCTDVLDYEFLGFRDVHRKHNGTPTHWVSLDFKVRIDSKKVANGEPHKFKEVKFFRLETLPKEIHSQLPYFLEKYKKEL